MPKPKFRDEIAKQEWVVNRLAVSLAEARTKLDLLYQQKAGISIGDIVRHNGLEVKVTEIKNAGLFGKPWVVGVLKKKNGEWGNASRHCYSDWEKLG